MRALTIVGARPQFVKLAPVSRAMAASGAEIEDLILHTGQHYDAGLSDVFFSELDIPRPTVHLEIGSGSHGQQTGRMLEAVEASMLELEPDIVVVYGDTNSTLAGALAAAKLHLPIAHVEAGLRSFDRRMPEEVNRVVSDHVSSLLFAPTQTAMDNLRAENLLDRAVLSGDVMLDAVLFNRELAKERSEVTARLALDDSAYGVATVHRAANTDDERLETILDGLNAVARDYLPIVFPVHPRTRARIDQICPDWRPAEALRVIEPLGYLDMLRLVDASRIVFTDSGGLQKEACFLGKPCLTLRDETEWPETLESGGARLVGADVGRLRSAVADVLGPAKSAAGPAREGFADAFGDGRAAEKIVAALEDLAGGST